MPKDGKQYDRSAEDLGNIVGLEHVNLQVEDQGLTTLFYISGLGLTRDPYLMTSIDNMWVNVGHSQFHLITGKPQHLRGRTGLVIPDREALLQRLEQDEEAARGHALRLQGARGPCRDHVPVGQQAPDPRARQLRPHAARHALCRVRRAGGLGQGASPTSTARSSRRRRASMRRATCRRRASRSARRRSWCSARPRRSSRPTTAITSRSTSPTSRGRTSALLERKLVTEESNQYQYRFEEHHRSRDRQARCSRSSTRCAA